MTKEEVFKYDNSLCFRLLEDPLYISRLNKSTDVEFICPKHMVPMPNILIDGDIFKGFKLVCPICERDERYEPLRYIGQRFEDLQRKAFSLYQSRNLKDAKLIRLDDIYTPEIKGIDALKGEKCSDYFVKADVKRDIDGHTIVVLYVGYKGEGKAQFFIKPEKLQLTHDHKDMDPKKILAKIELTLKDRTIKQDYNDEKA